MILSCCPNQTPPLPLLGLHGTNLSPSTDSTLLRVGIESLGDQHKVLLKGVTPEKFSQSAITMPDYLFMKLLPESPGT